MALAATNSAFALDARKALTQYSRTVWTQQQGLPQDTIRAITQTADGYLWLGTDEGLARFDGYEFVVFNRDHDNLPSNSITALAASRDGSLWIGTPNGLAQYRDKHFRSYTQKDGLPDNSIGSLFVDHAGTLWIVAGGNLSRLDGTHFTNFRPERDIPMRAVRAVTENAGHTLLVAGNSAVAKLEEGRFSSVFKPAVLKNDFPGGMQVDHNGNLWILGVHGLIQGLPDGTIRRYGSRDGLSDSFGLYAIWEDHDRNLWVGTENGLARLEGGRFETWNSSQGGPRDSVLCIFEDREGNLWIGSNNGLIRFREDAFTVYGKDEGFPSDEPNAILEDHAGTIWIGFLDRGLVPFSGRKPRATRQGPGLPQDPVYSIRETKAGELLIAARDGLTRLKDGHPRKFVPPDPQGRKRVYDALEGADGRIWLAAPSGLGELQGDRFRTVIESGPVMLDSSFVTLENGEGGSIWAGTIRKGLWHVSAAGTRLYTTADGLGSDQIRSLYRDRAGTLWIGTFGGGLSALRSGKFVTYTSKDGLLSDNISKVTDDGESLWLSTTRGICRVSKKQLEDLADHRIKVLEPANYGIADGLRSAQSSPEIGSGGGRHSDGSLWFVTTRGTAVYEPGAPARTQPALTVGLTEMSADGRPLDWSSSPRISSANGRLQIRYSAVHLSTPDQVQYSYKLAGLDSDWVRADGRRGVNYTGLGHGHYRFQVRAQLPGGPLSEAAYEFDVLPHFYETSWFRLLGVALLAALVWMVYQLRVRQVRSRYALLVEERARLAREVHDTLAQGFVGISSQLDVVEMSLPKDADPARGYLDLARRMAQHSLTEARRSVMDLRAAALDDQDLGAALDSGARLWTEGSGIGVEVEVTGETSKLPEQTAHHILRIAQEAVTNAVKHARASNIVLKLHIQPDSLKLQILDNGCGFDREDVFAAMNGHFGLMGMQERAEQLGGKLTLTSESGKGTRVEVEVPLP
jgi:signal transduction histidine kinase/ligand-binding sensor domain-containing protein